MPGSEGRFGCGSLLWNAFANSLGTNENDTMLRWLCASQWHHIYSVYESLRIMWNWHLIREHIFDFAFALTCIYLLNNWSLEWYGIKGYPVNMLYIMRTNTLFWSAGMVNRLAKQQERSKAQSTAVLQIVIKAETAHYSRRWKKGVRVCMCWGGLYLESNVPCNDSHRQTDRDRQRRCLAAYTRPYGNNPSSLIERGNGM